VVCGLVDGEEPSRGVANVRVVGHGDIASEVREPREKGDDRWPHERLRVAVPTSYERLEQFYWEFVRDEDIDSDGRHRGAEHVAFFELPVWCERGVSRVGLQDAAEDVAQWVQAELRSWGDRALDPRDGFDLGMLRLRYVNALHYLGGHRLWKSVEARVGNGVGLAICIGSGESVPVEVEYFGRTIADTMHGYRGCLRTFPVKPHGRGWPWATWCPACREHGLKSNHRERAKREYQSRIAEIGQPRP
jgi:hypothetical protein